MDYEKKYKNALEWARQVMNGETGFIRKEVEEVFPELKESEDDMIRKTLIDYFDDANKADENPLQSYGIHTDKAIAWLEKQGDKDKLIKELGEYKVKYTQEVLSQYLEKQGENADVILAEMRGEGKHKFKIGDIISNGRVVYRVDGFAKNCVGNNSYFLVNVEMEKNGTRYTSVYDSNGKVHNAGEIMWLCDQVDQMFQKVLEEKIEPAWSEEDEEISKGILNYLCLHDACELEGFDSWYNWLKSSLKDKVQSLSQPKEWSEEDERMLNHIIGYLHSGDDFQTGIDWLKSLKQRYTWKPSDEQMKTLRFVKKAKILDPEERESLNSLYIHLKKLKGE